ncbi:dipeptidase [Pyramidobacter piscolens]|uniref:dipeptidase n=1 Tax=Pyramidobacter piscolens TaxID=638849 RepID=UPI002665B965|nr:C69 family dipeptidase [Pyramidobacter piscolens]
MEMKRFSAAAFASAALLFSAAASMACTPMGVGAKASADGSVMVSHTCDGWYDNRIKIIPGGDHKEGEMVDIYNVMCVDTRPNKPLRKVGEIPQAAHTYTYFQIGYPFMNDQQLMMGEFTWSGRDELASTEGLMYIENLEALGLARAKTAREAIKVMGALAEKYGYADGGETLIIGDPKECWVFEVCGGGLWNKDSGNPGAHWAAKRLPDDEVFVGANRSRLGVIDLNDTENTMHSTDITKLPEAMGWWKQGEPFDFSAIFNPEPYGYAYYAARREWRALNLVAPSQKFPVLAKWEMYPFSVKPDKKLSVKDIMDVYSDHLEGTDYDLTKGLAAGPFGCPSRWQTPKDVRPEDRKGDDWERPIALFRCSYSFVSQSRADMPDAVGGVLWFGEDSPDTTVYVPIYCGVTSVPKAWSETKRHVFDRDSAWWAFNLVNNWATIRWDAIYPEIRAKKASYEDKFFADQKTIEDHAVELYKKDPQKAVEYLTAYTNKAMNEVNDGWWDFAFELIGKYCDGGVMQPDGSQKTPGYPTEWLKAVDFGGMTERDLKATNSK